MREALTLHANHALLTRANPLAKFGVVMLMTRKVDRKGGIPFGPWMLAGAWLGILVGEQLWTAYLALFGVTTQL